MILYRYVDNFDDNGEMIVPFCENWFIHKETPQGYWISKYPTSQSRSDRKFMRKTADRKFANEFNCDAMDAYFYRKNFQLNRLIQAQSRVFEFIKKFEFELTGKNL